MPVEGDDAVGLGAGWLVEDWTYDANGKEFDGRQVWHVDPPGPKGSGIPYHVTRFKDVKADDGKWERHVYAWRLCDGRSSPTGPCDCDPEDNEPVEVE